VSDTEELERRVAELERRMAILFSNTGAIDFEEASRGAELPSEEVAALVRSGDLKKAVKLYQKQTGADMAQTMAAIKSLNAG